MGREKICVGIIVVALVLVLCYCPSSPVNQYLFPTPDDDSGGGGTDDTDTTVPDTGGDSDDDTSPDIDQWVLVAKIGTWSPYWPQPPQDMNVEIFDAATSSKVHTGLLYDEIFIEGTDHEWVVGTTHEDLITGFMVTIQVWSLGGSDLMITPSDYVYMAV